MVSLSGQCKLSKKEMKKTKTILTALFVCGAITFMIITSFASPLTGTFFNIDTQHTSSSNTYGYSEGNFTGSYDSSDPTLCKAVIYASCRGGVKSTFYTSLQSRLWDGINVSVTINKNSVTENSRFLEATINVQSDELYQATGRVIEECYCIATPSDQWEAIYVYRWSTPQYGWNEI